jgi:hypothetical protein
MKRKLSPWLPVYFCAFLSSMPVVAMPYGGTWWQPAFYCFLPLCFMYAGFAQIATNREIDELRNRLTAIESGRAV